MFKRSKTYYQRSTIKHAAVNKPSDTVWDNIRSPICQLVLDQIESRSRIPIARSLYFGLQDLIQIKYPLADEIDEQN